MRLHTRVIVATALAAAITLTLSSLAAFLLERGSLQNSVDQSLLHAAGANHGAPFGEDGDVTGAAYQLLFSDGTTFFASSVPVTTTALRVAQTQSSQMFLTVSSGAYTYRELVVPLPVGSRVACSTGQCTLNKNAAEVFSIDISTQASQLSSLLTWLVVLAVLGLLMVIVLAAFAARESLVPLDNVTEEIERVASSTDLSIRIDEGGADELGRLRHAFNHLMAALDRSQQTQYQLALDASHELRTPLTSLRTNTQVLSSGRVTGDDLTQLTSDMLTQVDELTVLISDLTELARGEVPDGPPTPVRLDELVEEATALAQTHARIRRVTISTVSSPCTVLAHPARLARAVTNLISNAVKFSPDDGIVHAHCADGTLVVSDSGPGIADADVEHVFDRFWRAPSSRSMPGSGLGLSIVDQVVKETGGTIVVTRSSQLGGAEFTMTLPICPNE